MTANRMASTVWILTGSDLPVSGTVGRVERLRL
jgi:hypothetical protein